jgi:hypothetical protein
MARKHITGAVDVPKDLENVDWEGREAAHTLAKAHEIKKNPDLHARAKREAEKMAADKAEEAKHMKHVASGGISGRKPRSW